MQPGEISPSERMWAALAHALLLINVVFLSLIGFPLGILITMAIWIFKRRTFPYVGYHALQAFLFQVVVMMVALAIGGFISEVGALLIMGVGVLYSMYGAFRCNQGHNFRYPVIGAFVYSMSQDGK